MRLLLLAVALLAGGCVSSRAAYRAHFEQPSEAAALRECSGRCEGAADVDACLTACPGFSRYVSDRCNAATEAPGTYCVNVETRLHPDLAFWAGVARAAAEASESSGKAEAKAEDGERDAGGPRKHRRATPSAPRQQSRRERARHP